MIVAVMISRMQAKGWDFSNILLASDLLNFHFFLS